MTRHIRFEFDQPLEPGELRKQILHWFSDAELTPGDPLDKALMKRLQAGNDLQISGRARDAIVKSALKIRERLGESFSVSVTVEDKKCVLLCCSHWVIASCDPSLSITAEQTIISTLRLIGIGSALAWDDPPAGPKTDRE